MNHNLPRSSAARHVAVCLRRGAASSPRRTIESPNRRPRPLPRARSPSPPLEQPLAWFHFHSPQARMTDQTKEWNAIAKYHAVVKRAVRRIQILVYCFISNSNIYLTCGPPGGSSLCSERMRSLPIAGPALFVSELSFTCQERPPARLVLADLAAARRRVTCPVAVTERASASGALTVVQWHCDA